MLCYFKTLSHYQRCVISRPLATTNAVLFQGPFFWVGFYSDHLMSFARVWGNLTIELGETSYNPQHQHRFLEHARGHPGLTGFQSHHTKFPYITLYMGFYYRNINRRAHGCAILGFATANAADNTRSACHHIQRSTYINLFIRLLPPYIFSEQPRLINGGGNYFTKLEVFWYPKFSQFFLNKNKNNWVPKTLL